MQQEVKIKCTRVLKLTRDLGSQLGPGALRRWTHSEDLASWRRFYPVSGPFRERQLEFDLLWLLGNILFSDKLNTNLIRELRHYKQSQAIYFLRGN